MALTSTPPMSPYTMSVRRMFLSGSSSTSSSTVAVSATPPRVSACSSGFSRRPVTSGTSRLSVTAAFLPMLRKKSSAVRALPVSMRSSLGMTVVSMVSLDMPLTFPSPGVTSRVLSARPSVLTSTAFFIVLPGGSRGRSRRPVISGRSIICRSVGFLGFLPMSLKKSSASTTGTDFLGAAGAGAGFFFPKKGNAISIHHHTNY